MSQQRCCRVKCAQHAQVVVTLLTLEVLLLLLWINTFGADKAGSCQCASCCQCIQKHSLGA